MFILSFFFFCQCQESRVSCFCFLALLRHILSCKGTCCPFNGTALFNFSFTMCLTKQFPHEFKSNASWRLGIAILVSLADICLTESLCNKGSQGDLMNCFTKKRRDLYAANYRRKRNEPDRRPTPVLRKKHHLSQQQLSERLETQAVYICRGSISRIEGQKSNRH